MAGNYPDVPAPRMAYDRDGTIVLNLNLSTSTPTQLNAGQMQALNSKANSVYVLALNNVPSAALCFIFPQLRDISGYMMRLSQSTSIQALEKSNNTTNGIDGTWTSVVNPWVAQVTSATQVIRTAITSQAISGVKAIRFRGSQGGANEFRIYNCHVYGGITAGETPDRLRVWHPTLDEPLDDNDSADGAYFDWGDVQRNTVPSDKTFRIKNNSSTLTANDITISQETLSDTTPVVNDMFSFSDGGPFGASVNIASLAPGAISSVISKRFSPPANAALSLWTSRTVVEADSWS